MKKLLIATLLLAPVAAFAQTGSTTASTTPVIVPVTTPTQVACIHAALEKRENSLITGHDAFNTAIKAALQKRLAGLKDAWSQTDKKVMKEKKQATWKAFRADTQAAHNGMRTARQTAWRTFDADMKNCGVRGHGEAPQALSAPTSSL